jgi:hypothetical protein
MFALASKLISAAALVFSVLAPASAATITLSDGDFMEGTWSTFGSFNGTGYGSVARASSGGHPDSYIEAEAVVPSGFGSATVYFFSQSVAWDPQAGGPLASVSISADGKPFGDGFVLLGLAVQQNGRVFEADGSYFYPSSGWSRYTSPTWTPADFGSDFSPSGAPMYFGFRAMTTFGSARLGVDNYTVTLTIGDVAPVPEPSTWAMLGLGLIGLAAWRRKA